MEFHMRVMVVSHRLPPDGLGGVEQYCLSLASELQKFGDTAVLVARRSHGRFQGSRMGKERLPNGSLLYRLIGARHRPEQFLSSEQEISRLFLMALIESAPEVVHLNHLLGFSPRVIHDAHRL